MEFEISAEEAGLRLDVVLVKRVEGMSRARARALTQEGKVRVNGRIARKGISLAAGDRIALEALPVPRDFPAVADANVPVTVLYEDADVLVVDKPASTPTHPLKPDERGTLANGLVARYPELAGVGYSAKEPGILHRLDTDTSGAVLVARNAKAFEALRDALKNGGIDKRYLALCGGAVFAPRTISIALAPHPKDRKRVLACEHPRDIARNNPRPATTELVSAEPRGDFTLVEASAASAGRHQIRAHLAAIGHPLAGDRLYGGSDVPGLFRHFLHAHEISFTHPKTGKRITVRAPLPKDLEGVLARAG